MSERFSVRAVVFDLDGTLIESRPAIAASVNHTLDELGRCQLPESEVAKSIGWGLDHLLAQILPLEEVGAAAAIYREHYRQTCVANTEVLPGVVEALAQLRADGGKVGIATNKPVGFAEQLLTGLDLARHVDVILGSGSVAALKPAPDMLLAALAQIGVASDHALYVGDMVVDLETATAAGVRFIAVATGNVSADELAAAGADRVLSSMKQLLDQVRIDGR